MAINNIFGDFNIEDESKYTKAINIPTYKPRGKAPHILELLNTQKSDILIKEVQESDLPDDEKRFLIESAKRHIVFNYELIADYYANATPEMQKFMERSALVIIDFKRAYSEGYIELCYDLANQYFETYGK